MNGIEKITGRIREDTQVEIGRILGEARAEADKITQRYNAQAEAEKTALTERNEKAAAEREERLVSAAKMEARKVLLSARQEMVEKAYALALEKLCGLPEERYTAVLTELLGKAAAGDGGEVVFSARDRERVGKAVVEQTNAASGKHLTLSDAIADIAGGFILRDRHMEVNCSFETLVRLQKAETAGTVAKKLFPDD